MQRLSSQQIEPSKNLWVIYKSWYSCTRWCDRFDFSSLSFMLDLFDPIGNTSSVSGILEQLWPMLYLELFTTPFRLVGLEFFVARKNFTNVHLFSMWRLHKLAWEQSCEIYNRISGWDAILNKLFVSFLKKRIRFFGYHRLRFITSVVVTKRYVALFALFSHTFLIPFFKIIVTTFLHGLFFALPALTALMHANWSWLYRTNAIFFTWLF